MNEYEIELVSQNADENPVPGRRTDFDIHQALAAAMETVTEGIAVLSPDGVIVYVNPAYVAMTGYERREVLGQSVCAFRNSYHPPAVYNAIVRTISSGTAWSGRLTLLRRDGSVFENDMIISPVRNERGSIVNYVLTARDVTDKVRMEEHLRQDNKIQVIGTLAGGIAHDFNNVLAVIMGFTEMAFKDIPNGSNARQRMKKVLRAAMRGRELVRQILAFSRKSDGAHTMISLKPLLNETLTLLRVSVPEGVDVQVHVTVDTDTVSGNRSELEQVIMNLVMNAIQAVTPHGGVVEVSLAEKDFSDPDRLPDPAMHCGRHIVLTVRDDGPGMSDEVRQRIFEPFFTTKADTQGTGIGLAMVYGIVKGHEGGIVVWSRPGKGSIFRVFLPLLEIALQEDDSSAVGGNVGGNERILFVDDEEALVESTTTLLCRLGYKATGFIDAGAALEHFAANPDRFDVVVADYGMPHMTGVAFAERLTVIRRDVPVIILTGHLDESVSPEKARDAGIKEFLIKPLAISELSETIRRVLSWQTTPP